MNETLTAIPGIQVGHFSDTEAATGCTVILCPPETVASVDVRGGAPGTRETDLLDPTRSVKHIHALVLSGGSAYGLAAATGVMNYLEEQGVGYRTASGHLVPIVPSAIVFDLALGDSMRRPDAAMGYAACLNASDSPVTQGTVGAGTGCRVAALMGNDFATKGGVGSALIQLDESLMVAALAVVNAVGEILDEQGNILAGLRGSNGGYYPVLEALRGIIGGASKPRTHSGENTVIGVVATNARLTKVEARKVAEMAHDGLARAVRPAHTQYDGDTLFALATGEHPADVNVIGAFGAEVMAQAIRNAVRAATSLYGVRALND
ncbi:MAG: P1 family peptidase [Anaerolineae bacterium]|nr:P1 family peptidase [Anaerolineae bacterium]NUQ05196.1 P1 family peptidase [Anaerolineae bacterium]